MKIYIICSVRKASEELQAELESYALGIEMDGHKVHLPYRDTPQDVSELKICIINMNAIKEADEIHIFWDPDSAGSHFDLGMAFALNKKIKVVSGPEIGPGKSFPRMMHEWIEKQE